MTKRKIGLIFLVLLTAAAIGGLVVVADNNGDHGSAGPASETAVATFAGGCFWCMEPPYDKLEGVISTTSGYAGGHTANPTYLAVSGGRTGHTEAVQIVFDPTVVSYDALLEVFWRNIDPTTPNRQFCDRGSQYRSAIFYHDAQQQAAITRSLESVYQNKPFEDEIVTEVVPITEFYVAEDYHQDYYVKNPVRYKLYRYNCGRERRLKELWGDNAKVVSGPEPS